MRKWRAREAKEGLHKIKKYLLEWCENDDNLPAFFLFLPTKFIHIVCQAPQVAFSAASVLKLRSVIKFQHTELGRKWQKPLAGTSQLGLGKFRGQILSP